MHKKSIYFPKINFKVDSMVLKNQQVPNFQQEKNFNLKVINFDLEL